MAEDFESFVEKVRAENPIENVIEQTGPEFKLRRRIGKYMHGETHNSLVVVVNQGYYVWNSNGEQGDVFSWVMTRRRCDFWAAVEFLAERARIEMPRFNRGEADVQKRMALRRQEDGYGVALRWMQERLWHDPSALAYARGRGWMDETIVKAGLGFTGRATSGELADLRGELNLHEIDPEGPLGVAILGYHGDVAGWARAHDIEPQENWLEWKMIPGLAGKTRLVYPHVLGGRVRYLSARNILGAEISKEGREIKSYNLPVVLVGPRQAYHNHVYGVKAEECVVMEGQGDAVSLAQVDVPAVALAGTSWNDHADLLTLLRQRHDHLYLGMDNDEAGQKALVGHNHDWPLVQFFGIMGRVVRWPKAPYTRADGTQAEVKDANDFLKSLVADGLTVDVEIPAGSSEEAEQAVTAVRQAQAHKVREVLENSPTFAECLAHWAGSQKGSKRDEAMGLAFKLFAGMDKLQRAQYRMKLCERLGIGLREFNDILKSADKSEEKTSETMVELLGGFVDGWLIEYIYDMETKQARFAYRDPDGKVGMAETLDINGTRYVPRWPGPFIMAGAVMFPTELGPLKNTRELVGMIELFVHKWYLLESKYHYRLIAYYILMTWIYDAFSALCYLRATGEAGAGKSELMRRIGPLCYRFMPASGATTAASFFRAIEEYRGTLFIDEADLHDGGDMSNDLVKVLNLGAMKGGMIWRLEEVQRADGKNYEVTAFNTYGPKLIAMRKEFRDDAVASRSLTLKLMPREPIELKSVNIPLQVNDAFRREATQIRNLLLRWRMDVWQPEIEVNDDDMDLEISARLNQVTMPIKALARADKELSGEIEKFLRAYNSELVLNRSMTIAARIVEALWKIHNYPDLKKQYLQTTNEGDEYMMVGDVRTIANELIDDMNKSGKETDEDDKKRKRDELTAKGVGSMLRNELQLHVGARRGTGYPVFWDEIKMQGLAKRYGVDLSNLLNLVQPSSNGHKPQTAVSSPAPVVKTVKQASLLPVGPEEPPSMFESYPDWERFSEMADEND